MLLLTLVLVNVQIFCDTRVFHACMRFHFCLFDRVKSDRCEISFRLERVNNIRSICGYRSKCNLFHCGLPKWNHTCNHPLRACLHETQVNSNRFEISDCLEKSFRLQGIFTTANLEISNSFQKLSRLHGDFAWATFQTIVRF